MKKNTTLLLISTALLSLNLHSQNWVNGGNTLSANGTLGTNSSHSLLFETANVPRGILTSAGRWHLGAATTPTAKVQVTYNGVPGDPQLTLMESGNDYSRLYFKNTNTSAYFGIAATPQTSTSAAKMNFLYSPTGDIMTILGNKRVGIGTTSPAATFHVVGNSAFVGNVGIGTTTPSSKLDVIGTISAANTTNNNTAIGVRANAPGYGVYATSPGVYDEEYEITGGGIGVYGAASGYSGTGVKGLGSYYYGTGVLGIGGENEGTGVSGSGYYGTSGRSDGEYGIGVQGDAYGTEAYGVSAYSQHAIGVFGSTGNTASYAGYFSGDIYTSGNYQGSDRKLKQNIVDFSSALEIIGKLHPKAYEYKQEGSYQLMNLPKGRHYGLIAQEVEEVLPDLVKSTTFNTRMARPAQGQIGSAQQQKQAATPSEKIDYKAVNYTELIPIMVKAMQELRQKDEELTNRADEVAELRKELAELKQLVSKLTGQSISTSASSNTLQQNSPNPVRGTTRIHYSLPEGTKRAQLQITDALGRTIKTIQLNSSGIVNFNASTLSSGVYNYSLIVEGKTVQTRKMTVER